MEIIRKIAAMTRKEAIQIVRDPSSIFIAFVLPLTLLLIFGYGVSLDLREISFGIAIEEDSTEARSLAGMFEGGTTFNAYETSDRRPVITALTDGHVNGVLVIPRGFSGASRSRASGGPSIQILTDGTFPNTSTLVENYALSVALGWFERASGAQLPVSVVPRVWYNETVDSRFFIIPAMIVVIMTLIGTMLTALVVAREWERGTMEAMLSTPLSRFELLAGKLIPYYLLAILSTFFCVIFSTVFFGIPYRGSFFMLWAVGSIFMMSALSIGLIISSITKNQYAASIGALMLSFMPAIMLSDGVFELSSMPTFQQVVAAMLPGKYLTSCLLTLFLVGDVPELLLPNMAILALLGAIGLAATYFLTATRIE